LTSLGFQLAASAALLVTALTGIARADDVQGKLGYCKDCHGVAAQGYRGYFPIPRLAGQQPQYLENQLRAFIQHRRTNNIMFNVAHALSPAMVSALAAHFRSLNPARAAISFKTACQTQISRLAPPAMGRTPRAQAKFHGSRVSSILTSSRNW
jgi:cytochrome c553